MHVVEDEPRKFDQIILTQYPQPIAVGYRHILDAVDWEVKVRKTIQLFETSVRITAICLMSQYLHRDLNEVKDPVFDHLLLRVFQRPITLGTWVQVIFKALNAYSESHERFFIKELYEEYWDTKSSPYRANPSLQKLYHRLVEIRNTITHRPPYDADSWELLGSKALDELKKVLNTLYFFRYYSLIHMLGSSDYILFKGENSSAVNERIQADNSLINVCYLANAERTDFLSLHPFVFYWHMKLSEAKRGLSDVALFDRLSTTIATYYMPVSYEVIRTPVWEWTNLINGIQRESKEERRESWDVFICHTWEDKESFVGSQYFFQGLWR